jgi:hypothetical protein
MFVEIEVEGSSRGAVPTLSAVGMLNAMQEIFLVD